MQEKKVTYQELARQAQKTEKHQIVLAIADGKIRELFQTAKEGEEISFLTTADRIGHDTWVRSAVMLLMKAASDVAGSLQKGKLKVEFSIGRGLYCSPRDGRKVDSTFIDQVRERMRELAVQKIPFVKMTKTTDDAIALFESQGMADKVQLFRYRRASCINVYELDGYYDYNYGYMVPDTGYIDCFDLFPYQDGLMLQLPERRDPEQLPVFEERKKLFKALEDSTRWGEKLGITTVGDLNDKICGGDLAELILVQEAMQESRIGRIAEDIAGQAEQSCKNVGAILEAAGSGFDKVFKTTCFLADMGDFATFNEVYAKYFTSKPARSCVAVKTLPKGVLCEIEAIAVK